MTLSLKIAPKYEPFFAERPPSLKLILKVNGTPEYGSSDSPYNVHHEQSSLSLEPPHSEHSEKHKKSKKKKKKKDREKRHKHHKKDRHNRRDSSVEDGTTTMLLDDDDESSQLMTESAQLYYSAMSTSSAICSNPVTKPMLAMQELPKMFHALQNVPSSSIDIKPETPIFSHDSPMTPSSVDSGTREPRTCVLKLKQSRSPLAKLLDHVSC